MSQCHIHDSCIIYIIVCSCVYVHCIRGCQNEHAVLRPLSNRHPRCHANNSNIIVGSGVTTRHTTSNSVDFKNFVLLKWLITLVNCTCIYRSIDVDRLSQKVEKPAIIMDYLKSIGFMETNGSTNKGPGKVFTIPASVSIAEIKIQHKKLMSSLDNYLIVINDTMDIINEINKFYQQCMDNIQNDSNSTDEKQPKITSEIASATTMTTPNSNTVNNRVLGIKSHVDPVISHMIPICLQHLASPYKLYEIVKTLYRNIKHMLGVLLNKNLNVKYTGDRWKCWICNKSNNSILRDITCPQCGDGSINPHFFGIQTESSNINCNGKLECGIAKLTVYKNKNNKVCVLFLEYGLQFCLVANHMVVNKDKS